MRKSGVGAEVHGESNANIGVEEYDQEVRKLLDRLTEELMHSRGAEGNPCCRVLNRNFSEVGSAGELRELIRQCKVVFINFYSTYCPHCMVFDRVFRTVGARYSRNALFIRVNVMVSPDIAVAFYVMGVPTTVAIVDGAEVDRVIGLVPPRDFDVFVRRVIESHPCNE